MLTQLRIQNFKAWQDTGDIRLAPLTVFFGTNSSGKTSLLQFLLMLKQTVQSPDRRRVLNFGDSRSLVDLGVWPEMIFRHDASRVLSFKLDWLGPVVPAKPADEQKLKHLSFEAKVGKLEDAQAPVELDSFKYQIRPESSNLTPDQVALYFCKPGPEGSTIEELKLDEYGNITNWPENFFGDEVGDLAAMTEAAMKRQMGSEES